MSLDRKDIRAKLSPEHHAMLKAICEADGVDVGEYIEAVLVPVIERRVHGAMMISTSLLGQGITGNNREKPGVAGKTGPMGGA